MWKKSDTEEYGFPKESEPHVPNASTSNAPALKAREHATIGSTVSIHGDLTGEEDLLIEGRIEGKIECRRHSVVVGKNGHIKGDIYGKNITVEGDVEGNLYGDEQLSVRKSGTVHGNIVAPRVSLEDGANFKGSIEMSPKEKFPAASTQYKGTAAIATEAK
jgi:cytoskeletal protein CcmA (bactofilin family)